MASFVLASTVVHRNLLLSHHILPSCLTSLLLLINTTFSIYLLLISFNPQSYLPPKSLQTVCWSLCLELSSLLRLTPSHPSVVNISLPRHQLLLLPGPQLWVPTRSCTSLSRTSHHHEQIVT